MGSFFLYARIKNDSEGYEYLLPYHSNQIFAT